jgi:hypothetical protein
MADELDSSEIAYDEALDPTDTAAVDTSALESTFEPIVVVGHTPSIYVGCGGLTDFSRSTINQPRRLQLPTLAQERLLSKHREAS